MHPKFKTELCAFWESGSCKRGEQCAFAHSRADLRSGAKPHRAPAPGAPYKTELCRCGTSPGRGETA